MKTLITTSFFFFLISIGHAQSITWEKQFHFDTYNETGMAVETSDSGFFVPAYIGNDSFGGLWLVKIDKNGNFQWKKMIDGYAWDIESLTRTKAGTYSLIDVGAKYDSIAKKSFENHNFIDFDENGNILWTQNYNAAYNNYLGNYILQINSGGYILLGALFNGSVSLSSSNKMIVKRFNNQNQIIWVDTFNFAKKTSGEAIIQSKDNEYLIGGTCLQDPNNETFSYLLRLDSNGKKLAYIQYPYIPDSSEQVDYIGQLKNGNILVQTSGKDYYSVFFTLADSLGNTIKRWEKDGAYHNGTGGFVTDGDSILLLASEGIVNGPLTLQKYDTGFHQLWEKNYDGTSYYANYPQQILRTADGGLLLVGTRTTSSYSDMVLIKVDDNGYCADEDLSGIGNSASSNQEFSVYPNPATDNIYINTKNSAASLGIDIFDSRGVKVLSVQEAVPGIQSLDISTLNKGLYLYRLSNESGVYNEGKFVKE